MHARSHQHADEFDAFYASLVRQWEEEPAEASPGAAEDVGGSRGSSRSAESDGERPHRRRRHQQRGRGVEQARRKRQQAGDGTVPSPNHVEFTTRPSGYASRFRRPPYYASSDLFGSARAPQPQRDADAGRGAAFEWPSSFWQWLQQQQQQQEQQLGADEQQQWRGSSRHENDDDAEAVPRAVDLYAVLHVDYDASVDDIKGAFRRGVKACHPDMVGERAAAADPSMLQRFFALRRAARVLCDERLRARYDAENGFDVVRQRPMERRASGAGARRPRRIHDGSE